MLLRFIPMFNHAGSDYKCSICIAIAGVENDDTWIKQEDIIYRDDSVSVFISSKFIKGNEGHPLIVPTKHVENLYDLPPETAHRIIEIAQRVAIALKQVRACDGVTIIQNNEPAGDQHAFHYHMHVVPRFDGDHFHQELFSTYKSDPKDRIQYAHVLKNALTSF